MDYWGCFLSGDCLYFQCWGYCMPLDICAVLEKRISRSSPGVTAAELHVLVKRKLVDQKDTLVGPVYTFNGVQLLIT